MVSRLRIRYMNHPFGSNLSLYLQVVDLEAAPTMCAARWLFRIHETPGCFPVMFKKSGPTAEVERYGIKTHLSQALSDLKEGQQRARFVV